MRLLQRSLRSIMLTTPCNCLTAQLRLFPKKLSWDQVLPSCLTAHWNKNELILSKTFKKCSGKKKLLYPNSTSSPFYHCLNLFHLIFKHSHDPIAQVPDYMHVSVCAVLGGLGFKGGLMEMVGRAVGEITELCCSNWVKQVIQQCCFKRVTYHLSYVAESYFWQACNSN